MTHKKPKLRITASLTAVLIIAAAVMALPAAASASSSPYYPYYPSAPWNGAPLTPPQSTPTARPIAANQSPAATPAPRSGDASSSSSSATTDISAPRLAPSPSAGTPLSDNPAFQRLPDVSPTPSINEDARVCAELNVLRGDGNGVDNAYLAKNVTRIQAIFITLRLLGMEPAALAGNPYPNFLDVGHITDHSSLCALAYMRANPQLGWQGDENGMIDPSGLVTAQTMFKVLLSVLGYEAGVDFTWDGTIIFAASKGMSVPTARSWCVTNDEFASMLVAALKTRLKASEATLAEALVAAGVVDEKAAMDVAMLPGAIGYQPLLTYPEGGPLLVEASADNENKQVLVILNTSLNPAYAKATKNYKHYVDGSGYIPLPARCSIKMLDESTIEIQFPADGWATREEAEVEKDAFGMYIATPGKAELLISGLQDVDGNALPDFSVDVPE